MSSLPNGWTASSLGECADWYSGGTPDTFTPAYWNGDIPWITSSSLHNFYLTQSERKLTRLGVENGSRLMPENTIIFVVRGMSLKTEFRVGISRRPVAFGQDCKALISKQGVDAWYLAYAIQAKSQEILGLVDEASHGTGRLQTEALKQLEIPLPPFSEQERIAGSIRLLDDKIELNRRMNRTLESMARAVFRQWFINDEDVQGWRLGFLSDIAYVVKGVSYRSADLVEESDTALVTLKSMERGGGYREDGLKPYAGEYKPEQKLSPGEVVIAHTDLTQAADVIGRAARVESSEKHPVLVASLDMAIVRPKEMPYTNEYLYGLLSQAEFSDHAYGYTNGTTVLHLSTKALPEYQFRIPPKTKVENFSRLVSPIFSQIDNNKKQSRTLASLRDTLLPKLMRGEVRVKDV